MTSIRNAATIVVSGSCAGILASGLVCSYD